MSGFLLFLILLALLGVLFLLWKINDTLLAIKSQISNGQQSISGDAGRANE